MKEISLEEAKQLSLKVLCMIHEVCRENHLTYSLTGGTLLGAVRHKGFIPWDDDIDIMMPRPDYMRLIDIVSHRNDLGFYFISKETHGLKYPYLSGKACHKNTRIIERDVKETEMPLGVYVDVFPIDGVGNYYFLSKLRCRITEILNGLRITRSWTVYQKSRRSSRVYEIVRYVCYLASKVLRERQIEHLLSLCICKNRFETSKYAARLGSNLHNACIFPVETYRCTKELDFEGKKFSAIEDYDRFLTCFFGDYMQLPPVEKRVRHHNYVAYQDN